MIRGDAKSQPLDAEYCNNHEAIACPRCHQSFACKPASISACWCIHEKVSMNLLRELQGQYEGCLCKSCLTELAKTEGMAPLSTESRDPSVASVPDEAE